MMSEPSEQPDAPVGSATRRLEELRRCLSGSPRTIPLRFLYDKVGSDLFDEITRLPEYYPFRAEARILESAADEIGREAAPRTLVEFGSGSARKLHPLLAALCRRGLRCYRPLDVAESALRAAERTIAARLPDLAIEPRVCDFETELDRGESAESPIMFVFLGGTIGNLAPESQLTFLSRVAARLGPEDSLLMGTDLVKDRATLEAAYNDAAGVTAAFNLNALSVVNRELGADFDLDGFEHVAFFDGPHSRIELRLRATRRQHVRIDALDMDLRFETGDHVRTELSQKYTRASLDELYGRSGLRTAAFWTDPEGRFGVSLARRAR